MSVYVCICRAVAGSLCEELWQEVPSGAGQVPISQRNDPINIPQGEPAMNYSNNNNY